MEKTVQFSSPTDLELKQEGEQMINRGYAAKYNSVDSLNDSFMPGAFKKSLKENKQGVKLLWQHDFSKPIGKVVEIKEDKEGIYVMAHVSNTQAGRDAMTLAEDGVTNEFSVGYKTLDYAYNSQGQREIKQAKLYEVSMVTRAANPETKIMEF